MTVVDVEYEIYRCPCCAGYIVVRLQYPHYEPGCSVSLEHHKDIPDYVERDTRTAEVKTMEKR